RVHHRGKPGSGGIRRPGRVRRTPCQRRAPPGLCARPAFLPGRAPSPARGAGRRRDPAGQASPAAAGSRLPERTARPGLPQAPRPAGAVGYRLTRLWASVPQVPGRGCFKLLFRRTESATLDPVSFAPLPASACWQHQAARSGFEVAYFQAAPSGWRIDGTTAAVEDDQTWIVSYSIRLDASWLTREA